MQRFAIIGHPVSHSLSPLIHTTAFKALGLDAFYEAIDTEESDLGAAIQRLRESGYSGLNVTIPHKEAVIPHVDEIDQAARSIGAVNTISIEKDRLKGTNTDSHGFAMLVEPYAAAVEGADVALLGAGGAARAVVHALTTRVRPRTITVFNRTLDRAERLIAQLGSGSTQLKAETLFQDGLQKLIGEMSLIVNSTPVGMKPFVDATPLDDVKFRKGQVVIDLLYSPSETALMKKARASGANAVNGMDMLLHQAAESFKTWTGKEMPLKAVRSAVENHLASA